MTLTQRSTVGTYEVAMLHAMLEQQREFRLDQLAQLDRGDVPGRRRTDADLEVERSLRAGARRALTEVESALGRMRSGTFGRCLECGSLLSPERLEILPHVALCMDCQRGRDSHR